MEIYLLSMESTFPILNNLLCIALPTKTLDGTSDDLNRIFVSKSVCPVDKVNYKGLFTSSKIQNLYNI